VTKPTVVDHSR